jgi:hypothetical protein
MRTAIKFLFNVVQVCLFVYVVLLATDDQKSAALEVGIVFLFLCVVNVAFAPKSIRWLPVLEAAMMLIIEVDMVRNFIPISSEEIKGFRWGLCFVELIINFGEIALEAKKKVYSNDEIVSEE